MERTVYRGTHGGNPLESRRGSLTFCDDYLVARIYAKQPNDHGDIIRQPQVITASVTLSKLFVELTDPFIDLPVIIRELGRTEALRIAIKFFDEITTTDQWSRVIQDIAYSDTLDPAYFFTQHPELLTELYFMAYPLFDDADEVKRLRVLGYDGAIMVGSGESMDCLEYRVFNLDQITVLNTTAV